MNQTSTPAAKFLSRLVVAVLVIAAFALALRADAEGWLGARPAW